jgi:hypothetical protein
MIETVIKNGSISMTVENRPLVTNEHVEFEKQLVQIQDFKKLLIYLEDFVDISSPLTKKN